MKKSRRPAFYRTFAIVPAGVLAFVALATPATAQLQPTIGPQVRVDPGGGTFSVNETTGVTSDAAPDEMVVGWNDWRLSPTVSSEVISAGFAVTLDGGQTWTDFLLRPPAANQSSVEGDPFTASDPQTGALWAGAITFFAGSNSGIYVAHKDPGNASFNASVMARTASGTDKPWMAAGPDPFVPTQTNVYIAYNEGILKSTDMGDTWTSPLSLGTGIGFLPRVGPAGEVYVSYWDFGTGLLLKRSIDGGANFTTHTIATRLDTWGTQDGSRFPGTFRVPAFGYLAVCPSTGTLYACYFDSTSFSGGNWDVDIWFTKSIDQGTTWDVPTNVIDAAGDQLFTWMECDADGRLHLVYCDSRNTIQNDGTTNGMFDVYYAYSVSGGATWTEHRLTPASWNSNNDGLNRSQQFIGDYFGMSLGGNVAHAVYIDSSNGDPDVFVNKIEIPVWGDTDGDGVVAFTDIVEVLSNWGPCPAAPCAADVNGDGVIGFDDLVIVLAQWS